MRYMKALKTRDNVIALVIVLFLVSGIIYFKKDLYIWLALIPLITIEIVRKTSNVMAIVGAPSIDENIHDTKRAVLGVTTPVTAKKKRILIIGAGNVGQVLAENLEKNGLEIIGFIDNLSDNNIFDKRWPILGSRENVDDIIEHNNIDEVYVAYAPTWQQELANRLAIHNRRIDVHIVPSPYEAMLSTKCVTHYGDVAVVPLAIQFNNRYRMIKRFFDIIASITILILTFPLVIIAALLIKLTSKGPVIFTQERTGQYGNTFYMLKFRTMVVNAEVVTGPIRSPGKADMRLTRVGRMLRLCRIDELPQLINVLKGEMSIVGPRPERPCFTTEFERIAPLYAKRHDVLPGITGLAQICGGYHTDARDKLRFDLIYAANQSIWLDIEIILRTALIVICPRQQEFESAHATR